MATAPLVSCIMPTRNRRRFVAQSVAYFQRQDYEPRELVIVDDGDDPIEDLVPHDPRIRYVRLDGHWPLGRKRNRACELSRGELICHWDDDDWMANDRVSLQVAALLDSGADVCGLVELLHYRPQAGEAWLYRGLPDDVPWLAGGTLLYRRSAWEASPFPDIHVGEDSAFVWQLPRERVHGLADRGFYVALLHERNTAAKNLRDARWQRRPLEEVSRRLAPDREFYAELRNGRPPEPSPQRAEAISMVAPFTIYDGYGSMAEYLALGLERAGARVDPVALNLDRAGLSSAMLALLDGAKPARGGPVLYFSWPSPALHRHITRPDLFINTMWEASRLPSGWAAALNRARGVIVPTRFVARVCRDSGVTVPITVIPEGVDPAVYHYEERRDRESPTTLIVATVVERKHTLEGISAWKRAFADDPAARLIIKSRFGYGNYRPDDPRIRFVDAEERSRGIAHWYREADVLLALGSEGFGLPLVEGMATGLPVIALDSEGQSDVCEEARDRLLPVAPVRWQPVDEAPFGPAGVRGVPGVEDVAARLRWVADHRDEARALGRAASAWAVAERDIWAKGPAVLDWIEEHLRSPRSLRRAHVLWTPTRDTACGVAEYTRHLAEAVQAPTITSIAPNPRGARVLHIQHEPSLFRDEQIGQMVRRAHAGGVPVAVTAHAVTSRSHPWERDVDALVAHTAAGARVLRERCPDQRVLHIPHGCPTWFPPRKRSRGRVVATFGFLEPHKGHARLLEAARALGDVELLVLGHPKHAPQRAAWADMIRGLPVRWEPEFLAADEVARRLAAEADALVFYYDDTPSHAASGAVRIGLATGVPVLASTTRWFDDVREATYQPADLATGLARVLEDDGLRRGLSRRARAYCHRHSWAAVARQHEELWGSL